LSAKLAVSFFKLDTWVVLLVPFPLISGFFTCTTAKKLFVKILMTEVTVILFILVYPLTLPAPEVMGPDEITDMTSSTNKALSLPKLRSDSSNWATYSERILK
jgi:hypothetical protein